MKKVLFLAILFFVGSIALAQKVYFIYIQSEAGTPFYVKVGDKVHSSTASGYLILSKLKDTTYSFYLGQPGNQAKELRFSIPIKSADHGFLLKKLQNEWVLFDLQSMGIVNPAASTSGVMYESNVVKTDLFTRLLAKAVDDSTLLMEPVLAKKEEAKPGKIEEPKQVASQPESQAVAKNIEENKEDIAVKPKVEEVVVPAVVVPVPVPNPENAKVKEPVSQEPVAQTEAAAPKEAIVQNEKKFDTSQVVSIQPEQIEYKRSVVKKYAEGSYMQGFGLTFIDTREGVTDTIRLVIPNMVEQNIFTTTEQVAVAVKPVSDSAHKMDSAGSGAVNNAETGASCKLVATDDDYTELRKNMATKARGEEMLSEARKTFQDKCFSTEQVRKLSTLFLTQEGKFLFFKEAQAHVSDKDRFNTLIFEFRDEAYKDRFKSLLEN